MTIQNLPLNEFADTSLNIITNESKTIGDPYSNVTFTNSFTAAVMTQSGVQSVTLNYVRNSKRVTTGGNYAAVYNYTLDQGVSYTYIYLAFKPLNNKLFMWKYPHADSGLGVASYYNAANIAHASQEVRLAYYRLIKRIDTAVISADPAAPNQDEIYEVSFKSQCVTINGALQNPPVATALNNVMCFAQGPAFWSSVVVYYTNAQGATSRLVKGLDYYPGYQFALATKHTKQHVIGALVFDQTLNGVVWCKYSALGGSFGITDAHIAAMNAVIGEPADTNYEAAIRHAATIPLVLDAWPNLPDTAYTNAVQTQLVAKNISVTAFNSSL